MNWDLFNLLEFVRGICFIYPIFVALSIPVILTIRVIYWFISGIRTGTGSVIFKHYTKISGITIVCSLILGGIFTMYLRSNSMMQYQVALDEFAKKYMNHAEQNFANEIIFPTKWNEEGEYDARIRSKIKHKIVSSEINTIEKIIEAMPLTKFVRKYSSDLEKFYICKTISIDDEGYAHQAELAKEETSEYAVFIGDQETASGVDFVKFVDERVHYKIRWGYARAKGDVSTKKRVGLGPDNTELISFGTAGGLQMEKHAALEFDGKTLLFKRVFAAYSYAHAGYRYKLTMSCQKLRTFDTLARDIRIFAGQEI